MHEFREEQERSLQRQCEPLQAEQQRLARKHSEIMATTDRIVAQRQSSDDQFASRAASLERRACDLDAFLDELAREQTNHMRNLQEVRAEVAHTQGFQAQLEALKDDLSTQVTKGIEQLHQDINLEMQGMGHRFDARLLEVGQRLECQETAMAASEEGCRSELERLQWQVRVGQDGASQQLGDAQVQWAAEFREHRQEVSRHLHSISETQGQCDVQWREHQQDVVRHLQGFSGMMERVNQCCVVFQETLGKDREKAEATLSQLMSAMNNIRQYTGKYAETFGHSSSPSTTFVSPPYSFAGSTGKTVSEDSEKPASRVALVSGSVTEPESGLVRGSVELSHDSVESCESLKHGLPSSLGTISQDVRHPRPLQEPMLSPQVHDLCPPRWRPAI